ncbi:winged helix domain-containing protein [Paracoccus aerius]|uniref:winged helix domain-containing protein n=1 Tax=Paracoccus aerius TaxID=1915382 RepID=UPI00357154B0
MPSHKNPSDVRHYTVHNTRAAQANQFSLGPTRERAALEALIRGGSAGASFYDDPAPRWASSVFLLRKRGLDILTAKEPHGGLYQGTHARYFLRSIVVPVPASVTETE